MGIPAENISYIQDEVTSTMGCDCSEIKNLDKFILSVSDRDTSLLGLLIKRSNECSNDNKAPIKFLISCGAPLNAGSPTPLELAAMFNDVETTKLLISHGVQINYKNKEMKAGVPVPLYKAFEAGAVDTVNVLLNAGADPNIPYIYHSGHKGGL